MQRKNNNKIEKKEAKREEIERKKYYKLRLLLFPRIVFSLFILILVVISPLVIISSSRYFYEHELSKSNCYNMISEKDCKDLSNNARLYLKGDAELDERYSAQERNHFHDVKIIFDLAKALIVGLLIFIIIYFTILYYVDAAEIFLTLKYAGVAILSFMFLLILLIFINFHSTFFFFHALLFPGGNWTFPFDSTIITVFPEQFFIHAAITSFIVSLGIGLIILGISFLIKKKNLAQ